MRRRALPPSKELHDRLRYDPQSGDLSWRELPYERDPFDGWNKRFAKRPAGRLTKRGYVVVKIERRGFLAHRIIWKMMTGDDPPPHLDHRDENKANNRWENLRIATQSQNGANRRRPKNNTTGYKGVTFCKRCSRYNAAIYRAKKRYHLGYFSTPEEAHAAYLKAAQEHFGEYHRG